MLPANVKRPKRERLTYQRIFEELRIAGYRGGYDNDRGDRLRPAAEHIEQTECR